jgi:hypothetical protein
VRRAETSPDKIVRMITGEAVNGQTQEGENARTTGQL